MIATLHAENLADISKRDQCKQEYLDTESTIKQLTWEIEKNVAKIDKLESTIAEKEEEKAQTIQAIADVEAEIAAMIKQREEENAAFLHAKSEDLDAIELLHSAKTALKAYFEKNDIKLGKIQAGVKEIVLRQDPNEGPAFERSQWDAPEAEFKGKGARKGESKDIISILTMLIEDLNDEVRNAMKNEEHTQLKFEEAKAAAEKLREELIAKKVSLEEQIASLQEEKAEEEALKATNEALLKDEVDYRKSITPDCDWIIGAFEKRAAARTAEVNGLTGAKDYLSGAKEAALVQKHAGDLSDIRFASLRR
jgi:peptidoglycan hydrolase CwlO-like protein